MSCNLEGSLTDINGYPLSSTRMEFEPVYTSGTVLRKFTKTISLSGDAYNIPLIPNTYKITAYKPSSNVPIWLGTGEIVDGETLTIEEFLQ